MYSQQAQQTQQAQQAHIPVANVVSVDNNIYPSAPLLDQLPPPPPYNQAFDSSLQYSLNYDPNTGIKLNRLDRFINIVEKHSINNFFAQKIRQLEGYEICIICDDSGSMTNLVTTPTNHFEKINSRWQEAQQSLKIIVDIASAFDPDGVDIYYLNRTPILGVTTSEGLNNYKEFNQYPNGSTPLGETIQKVLSDKASVLSERKMLLIIFTDGEPNNMDLFKNVLKNRKPIDNIFVTIVACTDDDNAVGYLNGLDKQIKNLDVCDDYLSEMKEIKRVQGQSFNFSFGDYITKILLGSIDNSIDLLDEKKITQNQLKDPQIKTETQTQSKGRKKRSGCIIC